MTAAAATAVVVAGVAAELRASGVIAADDEAAELVEFASDAAELRGWVTRRIEGEPTAWITGRVDFLGVEVVVRPGLYVPRLWQTRAIAVHALGHLHGRATAVDACTGCGAIGAYLAANRPDATVVATDVDATAVACAAANGLVVYGGDLLSPLPAGLRADVVVAVPPYVPTDALGFLPRDTQTREPLLALDGGADGLDVVTRLVEQAATRLVAGGRLVVEVGPGQVDKTVAIGSAHSLSLCTVIADPDGDACGVCLQLGQSSG